MEQILANPLFLTLATLWTLPWKAFALWRAATRGEKKWFIALLVLNTLGVLDIIYLFAISKRKTESTASDNNKEV
ncbi:MAG: DUF5652 family protein [bacterium]|nr:DUF5652 family protein [bacterium]